ncbi:cysteine desulfurase [Shouchella clausii]|uniref:aminotransferase class V-fold PLP-dependent enzyme n=1 Tax=Shouchella clausii TaxID=79880 RepID=UPI000BA707D8|nr:aminotransferase class V-fold PLP-dependent enzyme [Shouchella clausii]PAF10057.1 cysteine desulfurase [Shouchella clausii]
MRYFDQAATSFPMAKAVADAVSEAILAYGANPGRGGHKLARQAADTLFQARKRLAAFFGAPGPEHIWFYPNATYALNQAILGFPLQQGDRVVSTAFEHNSVLRPLHILEKEKQATIVYASGKTGDETAAAVVEAMTPGTRLVVINHASNVTGEIVPLKPIATKAKEIGAVLLVDASQTAGKIAIDMEQDGIDLLACPGHKGLLGPQGTGLLAAARDVGLKPLVHGGTGHYSEHLEQPDKWPERYEAGTANTPGIAGLLAGLQELERLGGVEAVHAHEMEATRIFLEGISNHEHVHVVGSLSPQGRVAVVSFAIDGVSSQETAMILDEHYDMAVRAGLHCAPKLHNWYKTAEDGLVRASFGPYTKQEDVSALVDAITDIADAFR